MYGSHAANERLLPVTGFLALHLLYISKVRQIFMKMLFRKTSLVLFIGCFLLLAPLTSLAQTSLGILVGVVRDQTGAVVPKATVKVTGNEDGIVRTVVTQGDGAFRIEALRPQTYTVTVNQPSFSSFTAKNVIVSPSETTTYDVNLTVGSANQSVSVEADSVAINTENGQLTGIVNSTDIQKLPIFSLNPFELATTVPGSQIVANSGFSNGQEVQINGARPRANNYLVDSQEINDVDIAGQAFQPIIPDSFSNVSVLTSAASAEFGRAGGGVINSITKSGTNVYHGEVYERYAGSGLNALGGLERGTGITKTRSDQHIYGFTAGGPIIKNKLFAFGGLAISRFYGKLTPSVLEFPDANGYAMLQAIAAAAPSSSTPVVAQQVALLDAYLNSGVTSGSYLNAYNPVAGHTTVNTNVGPQPGCQGQPGGSCIITENFFQRPSPNASRPTTQWEYKIDYTPWEKDSFTARYLHARNSSNPDFTNSPGALIGFDTEQGGPSELGEGTWTHIFTANLLNEFRVSETRVNFAFAPTPQTLANPLYTLISVNVGTATPPLGLNQNFPQGRGEDLYQFQDTVGWTKGRHSMRIGFDIGRQLETDLVSQNAVGTLTFAAGGTNAAGAGYNTALGNFLQNQLGPSGTATKTFGKTRIDPHNWRSGFFGQDDIKINASLTINVGLRYDYLTNAENSLPFPGVDIHNPLGIITANNGVATANAIKVNNPKGNISPRLGFAYSPHFGGYFGDGKSVIRGGVGIFYDSSFSNIVANSAQASPNAVAGQLILTTGAGLPNATSLVPTITPVLSLQSLVESVASNTVNPITYQYNLGIERQFPWNMFFAVRYVGNIGSGLFANQQFNYVNGVTGQRLNPAYGEDIIRGNFARSRYDSLQVEGSHLFSHGFQIRGNYTWSKSLDDASEIFNGLSNPTTFASNLAFGGMRGSWGPSDYDHRNYFVLTYVWSPAGFHGANGFADTALNVLTRNWTLSGSSRFQSGTYSTFAANVDSNGDSSAANDRPIIGNASAPLTTGAIDGFFVGGTPGVYYDIAAHNAKMPALVVDQPGSVHFLVPHDPDNANLNAELGRNSYSNPGRILSDLALEKGFQVPKFERGRIVLRAEAQDIANHNNLNILNTTVNNIGNGQFLNRKNSELDAGRQLILWAKFAF
jgi:Carboxypeptidase regulatory-like domain/TonB-dependent Receptor Plug Domain